MHHPTYRIAHTTAFVTPVVEHWLEREIAQWVHPMKDRSDDPSHHERTLLPRSYISLLSCIGNYSAWLLRGVRQQTKLTDTSNKFTTSNVHRLAYTGPVSSGGRILLIVISQIVQIYIYIYSSSL